MFLYFYIINIWFYHNNIIYKVLSVPVFFCKFSIEDSVKVYEKRTFLSLESIA